MGEAYTTCVIERYSVRQIVLYKPDIVMIDYLQKNPSKNLIKYI